MNTIAAASARQLREVYFGGNWTAVHVFGVTEDIQFNELHLRYEGNHSLLELIYHQYYFVTSLHMVLNGDPLTTRDKFSFDHPPVNTEQDWKDFLELIRSTVTATAALLEKVSDDELTLPFVRPEYGTLFRNIQGVIEHTHYHLGQITLLKRLIRSR